MAAAVQHPDATNVDGLTASDDARERGYTRCAELLK